MAEPFTTPARTMPSNWCNKADVIAMIETAARQGGWRKVWGHESQNGSTFYLDLIHRDRPKTRVRLSDHRIVPSVRDEGWEILDVRYQRPGSIERALAVLLA